MISPISKAQFNPASDANLMATVGVGFSSWGVPIVGRIEKGVADFISAGGQISYQSKGESFGSYSWRHTIVGISARGNYHFNELLDISDDIDFYAGLSLGYWIWSTKSKTNGIADDFYSGSGSGGFGIGGQIGGRYFINENLTITLELGGSNVSGGGNIGITFLL